MAPWQYWLCITKPKSVFRAVKNASDKLERNLEKRRKSPTPEYISGHLIPNSVLLF